MGSLSIWHWMIVLAVGLLLFGGRGKISDLMGDVAKGIKSFKKGMAEEERRRRQVRRAGQVDRPSGAGSGQAARRGRHQGVLTARLRLMRRRMTSGRRLTRATGG